MNRDVHEAELSQEEYSFAINANFQDEHGNGSVVLQNEPSNIKCSGFKAGYKVVGHKFDITDDKTYFFLTNPTTGCSEIGYIHADYSVDGLDQIESSCGCDIKVVLEDGLENTVQTATCQYITLLSDYCDITETCTGCLNFSIDYPIYESNIQIKTESVGKVLYFTDNLNPQRYIQLDNLSIYNQTEDDCGDDVTPTCLQCDKMRIFKQFSQPCLKPRVLQSGGTLTAGVYEALIGYCTLSGEMLSDFYSLTNPVSIFDKTNNILDQTNLDYVTSQAIGLDVVSVDEKFSYYKIVVVRRNGLNLAASIFDYGVYPINTTRVSITSLNDKKTISLQDIIDRRTFYTKAKGLTAGNGYLFHYGLTSERTLNLQPVVNLLGSMVRWSTVLANEDLYADGVHVANYQSYMRDEVVPLSIKFLLEGGQETPNFIFIPRPPAASELEELDEVGSTFITDTNNGSVLKHNPSCNENLRNKRWQFENTAEILGRCEVPSSGYTEEVIQREIEKSCFVTDEFGEYVAVDEIPNSAFDVETTQGLVDYINSNLSNIKNSTGSNGQDIRDILNDACSYTEECTPDYGTNCEPPVPKDCGELFAISVGTENKVTNYLGFSEYERFNPSEPCNITEKDSSGDPKEDTAFMSAYMRAGEVVYKRLPAESNKTCNAAKTLAPLIEPQILSINYLVNKGSTGSFTPLQTALNVSTISGGFTNKLHTNALWFKVDFGGQDSIIAEMSHVLCNFADDNTSEEVRISVFDTCSASGDIASYGRVVSDVTDINDPNKFVVLQKVDFTTDIAYIAIDSPIHSETQFDVTLTGPSRVITLTSGAAGGTADIDVGGSLYSASFTTDLPTTASTFVSTHGSAINSATGGDIVVTSSGPDIIFTGSTIGTIALSITQTNPTLTGSVSPGTADVVIGASSYGLIYNTDLTTTASNFVATHGSTIESVHGFSVGSTGGVLNFRGDTSLYLVTSVVTTKGSLGGTKTEVASFHTLQPPCGCFSIYSRDAESFTTIEYTNLKFGKKNNYIATCDFVEPKLFGCDPVPYQYGKFSYWESELNYPCNKALFDSSNLSIDTVDIPADIRAEFEGYYVDSINGSTYVLKADTDFRDKPIRHYKFPCSSKVPFMSFVSGGENQNPGDYKASVIYPIGFSLSNDTINAFLDIAVKNGLISIGERSKIKGYEIFRGDRRTDRSIIAKGLLFDTYKYTDTISGRDVYYPNYPLNSLGADKFNGDVPHPFNSIKNNRFTFHSPSTSFFKPSLPREMKVEGYQFGRSELLFDEVLDHSTYTLLGNRAYQIATALASFEVGFELFLQGSEYLMQGASAGTLVGVGATTAIAITSIAIIGVQSLFKIGRYRQQWIDTFRNLGKLNNFAYYGVAVGHYNYFIPNSVSDSKYRGIDTSTYLGAGRWNVADETTHTTIKVNNVSREDSVFVNLGSESYAINYPSNYISFDNAELNPDYTSRRGYSGTGRSAGLLGNTASPYVSLKQYLPAQYGQIHSVEWVYTGYKGVLAESTDCSPIFGGDTFISRFALKRKLPFFTSNAHGLAPGTPFKYTDYFNINPIEVGGAVGDRKFIDYLINDEDANFTKIFVFPGNRSKFNLDPTNTDRNVFYVKPPAKFYLFSYGMPYFLVESGINCNFRYARPAEKDNFYPNIGDVIDYTQESNVSIKEPNTYFYNTVYSLGSTKYPWYMLPSNYDPVLYDKLTKSDNLVIYSKQDNSETNLFDPWLIYKKLDQYQFPLAYGKLVDMDSIESEQILGRFEDGITLFGAIDQIRDRLTPETKNLGTGGIFAGRNINFNKTDLGYGGTQHVAKVSCEFGHFWADAKRGKVFGMGPNGKGLDEITQGVEKWFKENLPFKIKRFYPTINVDNSYKGVGLAMGWDARLRRIFLTKLDYKPLGNLCFDGDTFYKTDGYESLISDYEGNGYTNAGIVNCQLKFTKAGFPDAFEDLDVVEFTDTNYFEDCSWTIAYSPLVKSWISYYSFKPNYYIGYHNYFQTGINSSVDPAEEGLWSHLSFLSSYQVFYGKLHPFTIEYATKTKGTNSMLVDLQYWLDVRKYYNKYDYSDAFGVGFNKGIVYNNHQNTGELNLFHQKNNDLSQNLKYPKHNLSSVDILQTEINGKWSFNYLYNVIRNEKNGLPLWLYDCSQVEKSIDHRLMDYRSTFKDRMRGDYFLVRLTNDLESRFKFLFRFGTDMRDYYEQ